jgi:hypothetical protein
MKKSGMRTKKKDGLSIDRHPEGLTEQTKGAEGNRREQEAKEPRIAAIEALLGFILEYPLKGRRLSIATLRQELHLLPRGVDAGCWVNVVKLSCDEGKRLSLPIAEIRVRFLSAKDWAKEDPENSDDSGRC